MRQFVRTPQFQQSRDAVLNTLNVPLPERLFTQAITGGVVGGVRELPASVMQTIRSRTQLRDKHLNEENRWLKEKGRPIRQDSSVGLYGGHRDAHLGLGSVGVWQKPGGNVVIRDRWKVDNPNTQTTSGVIPDLGEGGPIPSMIFRAAHSLGTYNPIDIEVVVPPEKWNQIPPVSHDRLTNDTLGVRASSNSWRQNVQQR